MNRRRKTFSTFRRASDRGRNFPGHRAPQPTFSQTLRDMSFGDILPGSIEKRIVGNWITPEEAAVAIRDGDGSGIRIAILDSGVEIGHPDFRGRQLDDDLVMDDVNLGEFAEGEGEDTYGHGTAIAGIIWKVAPEAGITSFRVLGPKLAGRTAQVWLAANEAITRGFDIINCSFACGISGHLSLYKEWTDRALVKGVHVVAASHGEEPEWPAHFASVLAVDYAESEMDEGQISYSDGRMVGFTAAADSEVPWKDGTHRSMTGSSFAAALMTGIVARLLSVYPIRDPLLLKALLRRVYGGEENWS